MTFFCRNEDWIQYLDSISGKLDIKEKMKLDQDLVKYLDRKKRSESVVDGLNILEIFEPILPNIREVYENKLAKRDCDEFDENNIFCGIKSEDGMFYSDYFLPSAIYYIYQMWLKTDVEKLDIFRELFTLGSGSRTKTLTPELSPFCEECADEGMDGGKVRQINLAVFKSQICHKFLNPSVFGLFVQLSTRREGSDDWKEVSDVHREVSDEEKLTEKCNPFLSDDDEDDDDSPATPLGRTNPFDATFDSDEELCLDGCDQCCATFPSEEFVAFHKKLFHSKVIKPKFVKHAENLMLSFNELPGNPGLSPADFSAPKPSSDTKPIAKTSDKRPMLDVEDSSRRCAKSKYKLRKSLKY